MPALTLGRDVRSTSLRAAEFDRETFYIRGWCVEVVFFFFNDSLTSDTSFFSFYLSVHKNQLLMLSLYFLFFIGMEPT